MGVGDAVTARQHTREVRASYIVHVYRRSDDPGREMAGIVESVEQGESRAFGSRDELWAALAEAGRSGRPAKRATGADETK
jgi:hypothetical protein